MSRLRFVLGFVAAVMLVASSAAHSLLGWKELAAALAKTTAPPDLVHGLGIGWHFGGVAMLIFGVVAGAELLAARRNPSASLRSTLLIGLGYVVFGATAIALTGGNPFFVVFIVPGLLLLAASWGRGSGAAGRVPA